MRRALCVVAMLVVGISQAPGEFRYEVKRDMLWGGESGVLTVDEDGIQYRSENGKTAFDFSFEDIRKADLSDRRTIRLYTYDRAMKRLTGLSRFEFNLRDGMTSSSLTKFLAAQLERPVVGAYRIGETGMEIPAYHRHFLGGCRGVLRFGPKAVAFESKYPHHSRTWAYRDIQTIGTMNAFHFRLTSFEETFNLDLNERLAPEDYRGVWHRVYADDFRASEARRDCTQPSPEGIQ